MKNKNTRLIGEIAVLIILSGGAALGQPVSPTLTYVTLDYGTNPTFLTGIRGNTITGQDVIPNGGGTGGLLYSTTTQTWTPFPVATPSGVNYPGAIAATPYGPSFGSYGGILRVVGSFQTTVSAPYDVSYLYDAAAAAGHTLTTLQYPNTPGAATLFTIAHSTFGNQVVGNYDTVLATGHAFLYDIPTGTYTTIDKPGAVSTTAYGVYGNLIAGGYAGGADAPGVTHGYIYNQTTNAWTSYDHPGALVTHFEGITGGGQAGTYNLVANWTGLDGQTHASVMHIDAQGNTTWIDYSVPGSTLTSANSMYQGTALGIYTDSSGGIHGYTVNIPGIYNPIQNDGALSTTADNQAAITGRQGDDVVNNGTIATSGAGSPGVSADTYGVVTNNGGITVAGAGSAAVLMNGSFGTLLNWGTLTAAPGAYAIATGPTASGSLVVNYGAIDGAVNIAAGPYARFENSGWLGISAPGSGVAHQISGTFVQTDSGTLQLRLGADGTHDALQVAGTARLAGALTLATQPGLYANQTQYPDLVVASGGLSGAFASAATTSPFLQATLSSDASSLSAALTRTPFNALPGLTPNQQAVGTGLEQGYQQALSTGAGASLYGSLFSASASAANVGAAYDSLSGEGLTGSQETLFAVGSAFVEAIRQQGAQWLIDGDSGAAAPMPAGTWRGWTEGNGGGGHLASDAARGAAQLDFGAWGGAAGIDYAVASNILVGVAFGGSGSSFSVSDRQTSGNAAGGEGAVYAVGRWGGFYTAGTLGYGRYNVTTARTVAALGLTASTNASFDAGLLTGRLETGYRFAMAPANLTLFLAYQPSWIMLPGYSEQTGTGSAPFGLAVQGKTATSQPVSLGVQADRRFVVGDAWVLVPTVRAAWVHEFATERSLSASFEQTQGATFGIYGAPAAGNAALLSASLAAMHGANLTLLASVYGGLSSSGQAVGGNFGIRLAW